MLRYGTIVVCVLSLVVLIAGVAPATTYTFTQLTKGSNNVAIANALNTVNGAFEVGGNLLGGYTTTRGKAGTWTVPMSVVAAGNGSVTGVLNPTLSQVQAAWPLASETGKIWGIDSNGDLAGYCEWNGGSGFDHFFPWFQSASGGNAVALPVLGSSTYVYARGMNNSQQIVGADGSQAVLWTNSGTWGETSLPNLSGGTSSWANAITNSGTIGGWATNLSGAQDAVTWTNGGSGWVANDLVNRSLTQNTVGAAAAFAVNASGLAVGTSSLSSGPIFPTYAAYFSGGVAHNLELPYTGSGTPSDAAYGVNDSGVIVGTSLTGNNTSSGYDAFIYDPVNGVRDLNTVFSGIIPSGWSLTAATAIDDNGDIIGYAATPSGNQAFLIAAAVVPEPSSLLLFAAGLMGLLAYAWRKRK